VLDAAVGAVQNQETAGVTTLGGETRDAIGGQLVVERSGEELARTPVH
jgi:hypothetical protein